MEYYITSDLHSFAKPFKKALREAGYNQKDKNKTLIICGDLFDRGSDTLEVYKYIKAIPKQNRILIRGNHESLYLSLLLKSFPDNYDFSNGTVKTFCNIAEVNENCLERYYFYNLYYRDAQESGNVDKYEQEHNISTELRKYMYETWETIKTKVKKHPITKWLLSSEWKNYYELDNFIFVHSFIPTKQEVHKEDYTESYIESWRILATVDEWEDAKWGCPWKQFDEGYFDPEIKNNKILVCGHWHASDFHKYFEKDFTHNNRIYFSKNLIALDACTALSEYTNVLVIKEGICYNQFGSRLKEKYE